MVEYGCMGDLPSWMALVSAVSWNFPGLESDDGMREHRETVCRFMREKRALCVKDAGRVVGVLLLSRKHNMICCLAVLPEYRRRGVASELLATALKGLDGTRTISVSTFREGDPRGTAPRALYKKFGFAEAELTEEFGYPTQVLLLRS